MTLFFLLALVAIAIAVLMCWALHEPGARLLAYALMLVPLPAAAGALDTFIASAAPGLLEILGLALTGIIGWAASKARQKWGIEIEARQREALHSALMTGALLALKHELTGRAAIDLVLRYIKQSVPDAIGNLKPTPEVLTDLAKAKLEQAAQAKAKESGGAAVDALTGALQRIGLPAT
ncbi:hypothetical protein [Paracoccus sp. (in: a-proteobacteria)]|uniref:hypothetical protein n=1 Tax=Paracoccus sp. TaxID=267 RepID=UPI0028AB94AA|nr:hypothetical protein [Paracoccus sp. (in: a-proteobacteria)]